LRSWLKCLAENTGGKFLTANNASDLSQALGEVSRESQAPDFQASLDAADTAIQGEFIAVDWTGPNEEQDYIAVSAVGDSGYINFASTSYGNKAAEVTLDAAAAASRGETILINWTGPNAEGDYIAVSAVGQPDYINYFFTAEGNPAKVQMPAQTGEYEIRYYLAQQNTVLASRPIIIKEGDVTLDAPSEAKAAQTVSVYWEGPNEVSDYIAVSTVDDSGYIHYFFTEYGNPAMLEMPSEPGEYELRYVLHQGNTILHSRPISVVE